MDIKLFLLFNQTAQNIDYKTIGIIVTLISFIIVTGGYIFSAGILKAKIDQNSKEIESIKKIEEKKKEQENKTLEKKVDYAVELAEIKMSLKQVVGENQEMKTLMTELTKVLIQKK
jgi:Tfp pilus assembly protein PilO